MFKFNEWLSINDSIYCSLHPFSRRELTAAGYKFMMEHSGAETPSLGWSDKAYRMMIKEHPSNNDLARLRPLFGKQVNLDVEHWISDDYCLVAVVKPEIDLPASGVPHIIVAVSHDVGERHAESLLADRHRWSPSRDLTLISYVAAGG